MPGAWGNANSVWVFFPALVGGVVGGFAAFDGSCFADIDGPISAPPLLLGRQATLEWRVCNRHPWRSLDIASVRTSCGCLKVESFDRMVAPGGTGSVRVIAMPEPRFERVTQFLVVELAKGGGGEARSVSCW